MIVKRGLHHRTIIKTIEVEDRELELRVLSESDGRFRYLALRDGAKLHTYSYVNVDFHISFLSLLHAFFTLIIQVDHDEHYNDMASSRSISLADKIQ